MPPIRHVFNRVPTVTSPFSSIPPDVVALQRKRFTSILTPYQIDQLNEYYNKKSKKPARKEKSELAQKLYISPYVLNRWFQAKRNKENKEKREKELERQKRIRDIPKIDYGRRIDKKGESEEKDDKEDAGEIKKNVSINK